MIFFSFFINFLNVLECKNKGIFFSVIKKGFIFLMIGNIDSEIGLFIFLWCIVENFWYGGEIWIRLIGLKLFMW